MLKKFAKRVVAGCSQVRIVSLAPAGLQFGTEARNAITRIEKFLLTPPKAGAPCTDTDPFELGTVVATRLPNEDGAVNLALRVQGEFVWELTENDAHRGVVRKTSDLPISNTTMNPVFTPSKENAVSVRDEQECQLGAQRDGRVTLDLEIRKGELVGITGSVGSGKSSMLMAMLNEMVPVGDSRAEVYDRLAYAPQQAWIINDSIRENILFGEQWDPDYYDAVVKACCLDTDIAQLPSLDATEVGERGVTLSGGQQARVALARAVYR